MHVDFKSIVAAQRLLSSFIDKTPLIPSHYLSQTLKNEFFLKLENTQPIGAFKIRGALNAVFNLSKRTKTMKRSSRGPTVMSKQDTRIVKKYINAKLR